MRNAALFFIAAGNSCALHAETQLLNQLDQEEILGKVKSISISSSPCATCTCSIIETFWSKEKRPVIKVLRINGETGKDKWKQSKENLLMLIQFGFRIGVMDHTILVECVQDKDTQGSLKESLSEHQEELYLRKKKVNKVLLEIHQAGCARLKILPCAGKNRQSHEVPPSDEVVVKFAKGHSLPFNSQHDFLEGFFIFYKLYLQMDNNDEVTHIKFSQSPSVECTLSLLKCFCRCKCTANQQRPTIFMSEFLGNGTNQDTAKCVVRLLDASFPIEYWQPTSTEPNAQQKEMESFVSH